MKNFLTTILALTLSIAAFAELGDDKPKKDAVQNPPLRDHHSFANIHEAYTSHLHLDVSVNFNEKTISGIATHEIVNAKRVKQIIFDIRGIRIEKVELDDGELTTFELGKEDELLGRALIIDIKKNTKKVHIYYKTSPEAVALQWLAPEQTAGKEHPYLFTQGQAILTRSWIPIQDSPMKRITYSARVRVPKDLMAVMSASNPQERNQTGFYEFEMKQSIPPYLLALAVGDLRFKEIGPRTGVYSEPLMLDSAAWELADMEKMLEAAEGLYGKYKWDRYDVIVLPPSFPFGGMENPRLTFATPTILAGDRSLVSLIAHELAHSWSGNLVTNATWNDFWLNEGFTVYFENRIMEEIYGAEYVNMLLKLNEQGLKEEIADMKSKGLEKDTYLKLRLRGRDPDAGMTSIAYDKGAFFLRMLESKAGRENFDKFLLQYFTEHQFQSMNTKIFIDYLNKNLIEKHDLEVNIDEWVFGPGLPASHVPVESNRFQFVDEALEAFHKGAKAEKVKSDEWTTHELIHFVRNLENDLSVERMKDLDDAFGFTKSGNSEILAVWFVKSIRTDYRDAFPRMEEFLINVGRRKFLTPIYHELSSSSEEGMKLAKEIYKKARPNYHSVSRGTMDKMLGYEKG